MGCFHYTSRLRDQGTIKDEAEKVEESEGTEDTRGIRAPTLVEESSNELTGTESASRGLTGVSISFSVYVFQLSIWYLCGNPE